MEEIRIGAFTVLQLKDYNEFIWAYWNGSQLTPQVAGWTWGNNNSVMVNDGKWGKGYNFSLNSRLDDTSKLATPANMSASFWFKGTDGWLFGKKAALAALRTFRITLLNNKVNFTGSTDGTAAGQFEINCDFDNNTWHHFAMTTQNHTTAPNTTVYLDGERCGSKAQRIFSTADGAAPWYVGQDSGTNYFDGYLDELTLWNITLNDSEIRDLYWHGTGKFYPYDQLSLHIFTPIENETLELPAFNMNWTTTVPITQCNFSINMTPAYNITFNNTDNITILNLTESDYTLSLRCSNGTVDAAINRAFKMEYIYRLDNCTLYTAETLNITVINETDDAAMLDATISYVFDWTYNSVAYNYSGSSNDGTERFCIYPDFGNLTVGALIEYTYGSQSYSYWFSGADFTNASQNLKLYVTEGTTQVTFTVIDTNGNLVDSAYIHILKYDIPSNSYTTTEITKTDSQGNAIGEVILTTTYYNFLIYYQGELVLTESAVRLFTTTRTFTVNLLQEDYYETLDTAFGVVGSVIYNNNTGNFVFTYSDSTGAVQKGCLKVDLLNTSGQFTLDDSCIESASATLLYNIANPQNGSTYTGTGYIVQNYDVIIDIATKKFARTISLFREDPNLSLFISAVWTVAVFLLGFPNPVIAIMLYIIGTIVAAYIELYAISWLQIGALVFLVAVQLYIAGRQNR